MDHPDLFDIELHSDAFQTICKEMDLLVPDSECRPAFDGISGGFKFSDEIPTKIAKADNQLMFQLVTVLRCLWGFRVSLIRGNPRLDLEQWWKAVQEAAPKWPGFLAARRSKEMSRVADECHAASNQLSKELDELDMKIRSQAK